MLEFPIPFDYALLFIVSQNTFTIQSALEAIRAGRISAAELLEEVIRRVERVEPTIQAYLELHLDRARRRAADVDAGRISGALAGVPICVKDNFCMSHGISTAGSKILRNFRSPYDAHAVKRLEAAGAIVLGKTNMDEFGMGSSTENSAYHVTRNPWDTTRVPGGTSGGAAAAVAAGLALGALASDTGGSIRQPASLCGVIGLKPTYGRVSRYGLIAYASSLDSVGCITACVADAALMLGVIAGPDPMDSTCYPEPAPDFTTKLNQPVNNLRIGLPREYNLSAGVDPQVRAALDAAVETYRRLGATIVDVSLPHTDYGIAAYYIIAPSEASSNLARYDGVHFGHRTARPVNDIVELFSKSRAEGFGEEVQRRIMIGTYALSAGYYDAYYLRALKIRRLIKQDFDAAFEQCDVVLCPTSPIPAFKIGEKTADPLSMYLCDVFTVTCNIAGLPGISIPCGLTDGQASDGKPLPIGMQLLGPTFSEDKLLRIAAMYERATDWHTRRPAV